jgi:hypothetical protein
MYLDESHLYFLLWIPIAYGIYRGAKKHGEEQYSEGIADAICMHHAGTLKYDVIVNEDGEEDIVIKIHGGKEE